MLDVLEMHEKEEEMGSLDETKGKFCTHLKDSNQFGKNMNYPNSESEVPFNGVEDF